MRRRACSRSDCPAAWRASSGTPGGRLTAPGLPPAAPVDVALLERVSERYNAEIVGPPLTP
jgi:hypothetical protein